MTHLDIQLIHEGKPCLLLSKCPLDIIVGYSSQIVIKILCNIKIETHNQISHMDV